MTFTIKCNNCQEEKEFKMGDRPISESIEVGITENFDVVGVTVESIDIHCTNCDNEINM